MAQSKATKKFERNHLKDVLKRRKDHAKVKQKVQIKAKRKARKAADNERASPLGDDKDKKASKADANGNAFGDMSVDEFFQGGFDIPEMPKKKSDKKKKKDVPSKTGKRKRTEAVAEEDADSDEFVEQHPVADDSESEAGSDDDFDAHKEQLAGLAEKDPDFYKYLKENDSELLDFEDADLAEIDALSASEDEETPRKKRKKAKDADSEDEFAQADNEVTKTMVKKWQKAMVEQRSLRSTKEVVLAFRAAAHLNEDEGKEYKYSISNPDGQSHTRTRRSSSDIDMNQSTTSCW